MFYVHAPTCTANRFSTVTVQYRYIFELLFGRYLLQWDNKYILVDVLLCCISEYLYELCRILTTRWASQNTNNE